MKKLSNVEHWTAKDRLQSDCEHKMWFKKCSICGMVISSEKLEEDCEHKEIIVE